MTENEFPDYPPATSPAVRPGAEGPRTETMTTKETCPHGMEKPWSSWWGPCRLCEPVTHEEYREAFWQQAAEVSRLTAERDAAESVIRNAAHLCSTRMEGKTINESYVAAYRLLFAHIYPDGAAALGGGSPTEETR